MSAEASSIMSEGSAFLEALKVRRFSPATVTSRQASLAVFFGWLAGSGIADVREVSRQTVRDYQLWLQGRGYAVPTVHIHLQALRRFFEHLETTDVILVNPCAGIMLPKLGSR